MAEYQISDKYTFNNSTISRLKKIIIKYRIFTVQFGIYSKATIFFFYYILRNRSCFWVVTVWYNVQG